MQYVFVTGASSGIGAAMARCYAEQGAILGLLGRRTDALERLAASLPNANRHFLYTVDVTDHDALATAAADFIAVSGGVDVVIAAAGISQGTLTEYREDLSPFETILATNVLAMAATFTPFLPSMKAQAGKTNQRACRLVGIASVAGIRGLPGAGAYSASKAAVISYCESLRVELYGTGIKVVTIAPGYIDTPMTQVNQYKMPFLMPVDQFAVAALPVIAKGRSYAVIPWQMGVVAKLLRIFPNWLYDFLFSKAPHKPRK